jgi:hypothetical protein
MSKGKGIRVKGKGQSRTRRGRTAGTQQQGDRNVLRNERMNFAPEKYEKSTRRIRGVYKYGVLLAYFFTLKCNGINGS